MGIEYLMLLTPMAVVACAIAVILYVKREKTKIITSLHAFFDAPDAETPSKFGELVDAASLVAANRIVNVAKMTLLQTRQVESRHEKALEGAVAEDLVSQASPIGAFLANMPAVQKLIRKNPAIAPLAMNLISGMGKPKGNGQAGVNSDLFMPKM